MKRFKLLLLIASLGLFASPASAQNYGENKIRALTANNSASGFAASRFRQRVINQSVPRYDVGTPSLNPFNTFSSGLTGRQLSKPFAGASSGGSVSPWLALSEPFSSSAHNYYTQVRPMLDQQRANQQQAARNQQVQRQLQAAAAQGPYSVTGNEAMAPTGHAAVYMNYGGYYTPVAPTKNR
jgi:hypothetical protein